MTKFSDDFSSKRRGYSMQFLRINLRFAWTNSQQPDEVKTQFQADLEEILLKQNQIQNSKEIILRNFETSSRIFGNDFVLNLEYFVDFWSKMLKIKEKEEEILSKPIELVIEGDELEFFERIVYNIDLLEHHVNIIQILFDRQAKSPLKEAIISENVIKFIVILIKLYKYQYKRSFFLNQFNSETKTTFTSSNLDFLSLLLNSCLHPDSSKNQLNGSNSCLLSLESELPKSLQEYLKQHQQESSAEAILANRSLNSSSLATSEQSIDTLLNSHLSSRINRRDFCLKSFFTNLVQFLLNLIKVQRKSVENSLVEEGLFIELNADAVISQFSSTLFKEYFEARYQQTGDILIKNEQLLTKISENTYKIIYSLLIDFKHGDEESMAKNSTLFYNILLFIDKNLDSSYGLKGFLNVFSSATDTPKLVQFLMTTFKFNTNINYFTQILIIINKLFKLNENEPSSKLSPVLTQLNRIVDYDTEFLQKWLSKLVLPPPTATGEKSSVVDYDPLKCKVVLKHLTTYLVNDKSINESVTLAILNALIQLARSLLSSYNGLGFPELLSLMDILSGSGSGSGHLRLFQACCAWLEEYSKLHLDSFIQSISQQSKLTSDHHQMTSLSHQIESTCVLLKYISSIINILKTKTNDIDNEIDYDLFLNDYISDNDYDGYDDDNYQRQDEEEEDADDGQEGEEEEEEEQDDDDSNEDEAALHQQQQDDSKLCTFTISKKEFMTQHWYYCHTCKFVDRIGVCTICANVCHKGHDLSYAKFGSFFCDCGAKEDQSCKALKKRESTLDTSSGKKSKNDDKKKSQKSPSTDITVNLSLIKSTKAKQLEKHKQAIVDLIKSKDLIRTVKSMSEKLAEISDRQYGKTLLNTNNYRALCELKCLKRSDKKIVNTEELFMPRLGSQEGAFENVRMQYSGEHGHQIKQLINSHQIKRVSMCCLATRNKKHLIVTHEKGKTSNFTVLELKALLKQDSNKRNKLTLTKLNTVQVPFTLVSIVVNNSNEDYIALNGLKDCQIIYLNDMGLTVDAATNTTNPGIITLHPSLEGSNYIIKSIWLPGSQTELALVTSDFVKIYDLSVDTISPIYFFQPAQYQLKVRDVTFMYEYEAATKQHIRYIIIMLNTGYIYYEAMNEISSAKNGPYIFTNTIDFEHAEIREQKDLILGGGISVYYSLKLQLLFWSYSQGKTFLGSFKQNSFEFERIFYLNNSASPPPLQALCNWSEISIHSGLVLAMTLNSNSPVAIMITPNTIYYQEIKLTGTKSKIQDMVTTRHPGASGDDDGQNDEKTTMIILCDDGSLKIYAADMNKTEYWLKPSLTMLNPIKLVNNNNNSADSYLAMYKARKMMIGRKEAALPPTQPKLVQKKNFCGQKKKIKPVKFPIDFFEKSTQLNDLDYFGNEILEIYNVQQLRQRLNNNKYIACTKVNGFNLEITSKDANSCIVGCRVLVGTNSLEKVPAYFKVFNRQIPCTLIRPRWFDICLTREETYICENKLVLHFAASHELNHVTIVDSLKVYGKTKDQFEWKDDECQRVRKKQKEQQTTILAAASAAPPQPRPSISSDQNSNDTAAAASAQLELEVTKHGKKSKEFSFIDSQYDRLLANCLNIQEGCLMLNMMINEEPQQLRDASVKFLKLMCPPVVSSKAKKLLYSLVSAAKTPFKQVYFNQKDEAQMTLILESLRQAKEDKEEENLFDWESYQKVLLICHSILAVRPLSLIKFFNENFTKIDSQHFLAKLNEIFWNLFDRKPQSVFLTSIGNPQVQNIELIIEILIEIMHSYAYYDMNNVECIKLITDCLIKFLLCEDIDVSFTAKKVILQLLKPKRKKPPPPMLFTNIVMESPLLVVPQPPPPPTLPKPVEQQQQAVYQVPVDEEIILPLENLLLENAIAHAGDDDEYQMQYLPDEVDEEEMIQIAMALSMNEQPQQQQQQQISGVATEAAASAVSPVGVEQQQQSQKEYKTQAKQAKQSKEGGFEQEESSNDMSGSEDEFPSATATGTNTLQSPAQNSDNESTLEIQDDSISTTTTTPSAASAPKTINKQNEAPPQKQPQQEIPKPTQSGDSAAEIMAIDDIDSCTKLYNLRKILLEKFLERIDLNELKGLSSGINGITPLPSKTPLLNSLFISI